MVHAPDCAAERERLMQPLPRFHMCFSASQVCAALWDHGEDELAERALMMSDADRRRIENIAANFEDPRYPLPVEGQHITHNHVTALAAIVYFEGALRPLARNRRRPQKKRPERFEPHVQVRCSGDPVLGFLADQPSPGNEGVPSPHA